MVKSYNKYTHVRETRGRKGFTINASALFQCPPMASDIWSISGLIIVAGLLLFFYHDNGDVVEIANNWEKIISLPKRISKRIAIG